MTTRISDACEAAAEARVQPIPNEPLGTAPGVRKAYADLQGSAADSPKLRALAQFTERQLTCSHCGKCTRRCEILQGPGLDMGRIRADYERITALPYDEQPAAVMELVQTEFLTYNSLRQCCFCGFCTAACAHHVLSPDVMRVWRELFVRAGLMNPDDSKIVMVDNEWHIFSAYRAIWQVAYPEFTMLDAAAEAGSGEIDTLFFPGCSLVSYAPDLMRAIGNWLTESGVKWCLSDGCCGSPLMSAGLFDRAEALRKRFIDQMKQAGVKRMITVCPGCTDEFREDMPDDIELVPLPELMWKLALERECKAGEEGAEVAGFNPLSRESLTFFDSCHDRNDNRNANAIRALMARYVPEAQQVESEHFKRGSLCCGAGGAVGSYDPEITDRRVWRVIEEAKATGAQTLVTMCPTCTYTVAQANLARPADGIENHHYLEMLFGVEIPWAQVFQQLNDMWTGEYGPWLNATFF